MGSIVFLDLLLGGLGVYFTLSIITPKGKQLAPLPPGPKPKPLIGNLLDLPPSGAQEWMHWGKHKSLYGPISSVTVFSKTIIILNSAQAANELLERRSARYSDRPHFEFAGMIGWDESIAGQMYNERLKKSRRSMRGSFGTNASVVEQFGEVIEREVGRLCLRLLDEPEKFLHHIRTEAGAIILSIAYGYEIEPHSNDPLVDVADEAIDQFSRSTVPGVWLVDQLPILRYVPDWVPGMEFKKTAAAWRKTLLQYVNQPFLFVKRQVERGTARPSYVQSLLEKASEDEKKKAKSESSTEEEQIIKWSAMSIFTGGADTTVSALASFFLAMMLYPSAQHQAKSEIDRVIGPDRLPTFEDRKNLPYINALVKEVLRWNPVTPNAFPHVAREDDIYEGYFIPKGSIIAANAWQFLHDPSVYHEPSQFNPTRFLPPNPERNPNAYAFGFGRRICPGKELADCSLFLSIATILALFNVKKYVDENGVEVEPEVKMTPGIVSHPEPFKCRIWPRNEKAKTLIRSLEYDYPFGKSDAEELKDVKY